MKKFSYKHVCQTLEVSFEPITVDPVIVGVCLWGESVSFFAQKKVTFYYLLKNMHDKYF